MLVSQVESSDRIRQNEKDDSERKVDDVADESIVKQVFEFSLNCVQQFPQRSQDKYRKRESECQEYKQEVVDEPVHELH